jgi:hypothetical protein
VARMFFLAPLLLAHLLAGCGDTAGSSDLADVVVEISVGDLGGDFEATDAVIPMGCPEGSALVDEACLIGCPDGWERNEATACVPPCPDGWQRIDDACAPPCPDGMEAVGILCRPPESEVGPLPCTADGDFDTTGAMPGDVILYVHAGLGSPA